MNVIDLLQECAENSERNRIIGAVIQIIDDVYDNSMTFKQEDYFAIVDRVRALRKGELNDK